MKNYLRSFNLLSEDEIDTIIENGSRRLLQKDEFFIQEGRVCQEVAFVESGFLRSFYQNSQGEEITYCFTFSNSFVTAYSSLIQQTKTFESIQAMTDVSLFFISLEQIQRLEQTSVNWLRLSKIIAEMEYVKIEKRLILLLRENADFRYRDLLENYPEYLNMIPLNHLASYLGITQRHLSRIRKSLSN